MVDLDKWDIEIKQELMRMQTAAVNRIRANFAKIAQKYNIKDTQ